MLEHINYTDKKSKKAKDVGIAYAKTLFEKMKNPDLRGVNFDWETSWQNFSEVAAASLFTAYTHTPRNIDVLEQVCKDAFKTEWLNALEEMQTLS